MHIIEQYPSCFRKIEDEEVNKDQILLEKEAEVRWQNSTLVMGEFLFLYHYFRSNYLYDHGNL